MMIGEPNRPNPSVHVPPWPLADDPTANAYFPFSVDPADNGGGDFSDYSLALTALQRYLPSNDASGDFDVSVGGECDFPVDAFSSDQFRMFDFKVRRCARARSHDWTDCPYAHPGEKARRRDPRKFHYSGTACADFRKGSCRKGDACEFAHGVFECWLHPARYRTQPCKDGTACRRRVCFFAHTPEQLRVLPIQGASPPSPRTDLYDGSPLRQALDASKAYPYMSPPATPPTESPPLSPMTGTHPLSRSLGSNSVNEMVASLQNLQLSKRKSAPSSWGVQMGSSPSGFGSPRGPILLPGSYSLPSTPTQGGSARTGVGYLELWDECCEEEAPMERVESGRGLRTSMLEKLIMENSLDRVGGNSVSSGAPDVGWVSKLLQ